MGCKAVLCSSWYNFLGPLHSKSRQHASGVPEPMNFTKPTAILDYNVMHSRFATSLARRYSGSS